MTCQTILKQMKSRSSEQYRKNVIRMGIPESCSIGVSTATIRELAKKIEKSNDMAWELWNTGYHEAKLLAVLLFDKKTVSLDDIERMMADTASWDLCDHLCKNLIIKMNEYYQFIDKWVTSSHTYKKRAAFTLIASSAIHDKKITDDTLDKYLQMIFDFSQNDHEHIKKAVSWALREIGKRDFEYCEKSLILAYELKQSGNKVQVWIANNAIKELSSLVKAEGRTRLISSNSQMGKEAEK